MHLITTRFVNSAWLYTSKQNFWAIYLGLKQEFRKNMKTFVVSCYWLVSRGKDTWVFQIHRNYVFQKLSNPRDFCNVMRRSNSHTASVWLAVLQRCTTGHRSVSVSLKKTLLPTVHDIVFCRTQLIWRIDEFGRKMKEAKNGNTPTLFSPPFYTSRHGYRLAASLCLNGDGKGKGTHISAFISILKGM